jgi:protein-S-isoprenylcysteine O-methyltransferase Ste14
MTSGAPDTPPGLGRQLLAVLLLPFIAAIVVPGVLVWLFGANPGWELPGFAAGLPVIAGVAGITKGVQFVFNTIFLFATRGLGTLAPWDPTRRLVVEGPYLHVRNPMITGVALILLGEAALFGSVPILIELGVFALANALWMPLVEEPGLVNRFGDEYLAYKRAVPRWIPRRDPWSS